MILKNVLLCLKQSGFQTFTPKLFCKDIVQLTSYKNNHYNVLVPYFGTMYYVSISHFKW